MLTIRVILVPVRKVFVFSYLLVCSVFLDAAAQNRVVEIYVQPKLSNQLWRAHTIDQSGLPGRVRTALARCWDKNKPKDDCSPLGVAISEGLLDVVPANLLDRFDATNVRQSWNTDLSDAAVLLTVLASPSYPSPREYRQRLKQLQCRNTNTCHAALTVAESNLRRNAYGSVWDSYGAKEVYSQFHQKGRSLRSAHSPVALDVELDEKRFALFERVYFNGAFVALREDALRRFRQLTHEQDKRFGKQLGIAAGSSLLFAGISCATSLVVVSRFASLETNVITWEGFSVSRLTLLSSAISSVITAPINRYLTGYFVHGLRENELHHFVSRQTLPTALTYYASSIVLGGFLTTLFGRGTGESLTTELRQTPLPKTPGKILQLPVRQPPAEFQENLVYEVVEEAGLQKVVALAYDAQISALSQPTRTIIVPVQPVRASLAAAAASNHTTLNPIFAQLGGMSVGTLLVHLTDTRQVSKPIAHTVEEIRVPEIRRGHAGKYTFKVHQRIQGQPKGSRLSVNKTEDTAVIRNETGGGNEGPKNEGGENEPEKPARTERDARAPIKPRVEVYRLPVRVMEVNLDDAVATLRDYWVEGPAKTFPLSKFPFPPEKGQLLVVEYTVWTDPRTTPPLREKQGYKIVEDTDLILLKKNQRSGPLTRSEFSLLASMGEAQRAEAQRKAVAAFSSRAHPLIAGGELRPNLEFPWDQTIPEIMELISADGPPKKALIEKFIRIVREARERFRLGNYTDEERRWLDEFAHLDSRPEFQDAMEQVDINHRMAVNRFVEEARQGNAIFAYELARRLNSATASQLFSTRKRLVIDVLIWKSVGLFAVEDPHQEWFPVPVKVIKADPTQKTVLLQSVHAPDDPPEKFGTGDLSYLPELGQHLVVRCRVFMDDRKAKKAHSKKLKVLPVLPIRTILESRIDNGQDDLDYLVAREFHEPETMTSRDQERYRALTVEQRAAIEKRVTNMERWRLHPLMRRTHDTNSPTLKMPWLMTYDERWATNILGWVAAHDAIEGDPEIYRDLEDERDQEMDLEFLRAIRLARARYQRAQYTAEEQSLLEDFRTLDAMTEFKNALASFDPESVGQDSRLSLDRWIAEVRKGNAEMARILFLYFPRPTQPDFERTQISDFTGLAIHAEDLANLGLFGP